MAFSGEAFRPAGMEQELFYECMQLQQQDGAQLDLLIKVLILDAVLSLICSDSYAKV